MQEKVPDFPNAIEAFFLILALFLAEFFMMGLLSDAQSFLNLNRIEQGELATLLGNGILFTAVMHFKHLSYRQLFHSNQSAALNTFISYLPPLILILPGLVFAIHTVSTVLSTLAPPSAAEEALFELMGSKHIAMVLGVCILAPVLEEMLFRGVILRSFLRQYPRWPAIVGSSLLFGLAHGNLYQFVTASLMGVVLALLYERSESLWPSITLHALFNTTLEVIDVFTEPNQKDPMEDSPALVWIIAALLAAYGLRQLQRIAHKTG